MLIVGRIRDARRRNFILTLCYAPDTDDLNGKFHRLASEATRTAARLKAVFSRLGAYPDWDADHFAELPASETA
jgi:hypothetical protein